MNGVLEYPVLAPEAAPRVTHAPAFWGVMGIFLVHGLVVSTWVSRIATIKTALAIGDGALGLALLGTAIGSVIAIPVCGAFVARHGSRVAARWSGIGFCGALILPAFAHDSVTLFAALLAYGAFAGANDVAINAQAVSTEKQLGTATISRFHAMFSFGGILGAAAGAVIAARGIPVPVHFAIAAALSLAVSLYSSRHTLDAREKVGPRGRLSLRRMPAALVALAAIGFCMFLSEGAIADWTAVYLKQVLGAGEGLAPAGYAVFSAAMAVFRFAGDGITNRIGRTSTIRAGALLAAAGLAFAVCVHSPYWALAGFAAAGAGFSSIVPLVFAAGGRIPSVNAGVGVATVSGIGYLGFLIGPPLIGFVSEVTSLRVGLMLLVGLCAITAALIGVADRRSLR
jgi:MFS family permease